MQPTDTMVLAFILPHVDGDINCLVSIELSSIAYYRYEL